MARGSKVPPAYKARYKLRGDPDSCGDDFAKEFASTVTTMNGTKPICNVALLEEIAERNEIDFQRYEQLNPGMKRMNVGNKLRARIKRGEKLNWWPHPVPFAESHA